ACRRHGFDLRKKSVPAPYTGGRRVAQRDSGCVPDERGVRRLGTVGAVYDRASFPSINEKRAVIDRAYSFVSLCLCVSIPSDGQNRQEEEFHNQGLSGRREDIACFQSA